MLLLQSMLYGFWAINMVFFSCELGQRLSIAYESIDDKIAQLNWYLLPMKIQRMLPIMMINTQQPLKVICFGSLLCTRDTFKTVINDLKWKH